VAVKTHPTEKKKHTVFWHQRTSGRQTHQLPAYWREKTIIETISLGLDFSHPRRSHTNNNHHESETALARYKHGLA
jgi:hypothetical protein